MTFWIKILIAISIVITGILNTSFKDWFKNNWFIVLPVYLLLACANLFLDRYEKRKKLTDSWKTIKKDSKEKMEAHLITIPYLNEHITLEKAKQVESLMYQNKHIIITGEAGVGKTGVITEISKRHKNFTYIYIDCRDLCNCRNLDDMKEVFMVDHSIHDLLKEMGKKNRIKLILDQCDSIWRTGGQEILFKMIKRIIILKNIQLILICRIEEASGLKDDIDKQCAIGTEEINIGELSQEKALLYLNKFGYDNPPLEIIKIAQNIFNITIFAEIYNREKDNIKKIKNIIEFWDEYRMTLEEELDDNPSKYRITDVAAIMAKNSLLNGNGTFTMNSRYSEEEMVLLSRGVIKRTEAGSIRCRFRHEKLRDYIYCYDAIQRRDITDYNIIEDEIKEQSGIVASLYIRLLVKLKPHMAAKVLAEVMDNE